MIYLWKLGGNYPEKLLGLYDHKQSPDRFLLYKGQVLSPPEFDRPGIFRFNVSKGLLSCYDNLINTTRVPLVNERLRRILDELAPGDLQYLDTKIICSDGVLINYKLVNVTRTIVGIDKERSIYSLYENGDFKRFQYIKYKSGCMGPYNIARDEEKKLNLLVSGKLVSIFKKEKIRKVYFIPPEQYYHVFGGYPMPEEDV